MKMHYGGKPAERVMLRALFCGGTLGSGIYVDVILTCSTYQLIIVAAPFMATVVFIGSENVLQDNVPCNTTKISGCGACWTNMCAL